MLLMLFYSLFFFVTGEKMIYKPSYNKTKYYIVDENTAKLNTSTGQKMGKHNHVDYAKRTIY